MSGALVAGLDAGLIYNEFPYMGVGLTPPKKELFDPFYSRDPERHKDLVWRNMLENPSLVQLDHRILATTTFTAVMALFAWTRYSQTLKSALPAAAKKGVHGVVGFAWLQVILGITTLLYLVPTGLASAHQAGALGLLTWTVVLGSRVWFPKTAANVLARRVGAGAGAIANSSATAGAAIWRHPPSEMPGAAVLAAGAFGLMPLGLLCMGTVNEEKKRNSEKAALELERERLAFLRRQAAMSL
jgi:cytochrome c oxidase assembly protein subunit 15